MARDIRGDKFSHYPFLYLWVVFEASGISGIGCTGWNIGLEHGSEETFPVDEITLVERALQIK
jgi:hypothetical protein